MPGRVFKSGCVQVVQNLRVLPSCLHPRSRLDNELADRLGEALYLPVYDLTSPQSGPLAVLEALLSKDAADTMLVANLMSFLGSQLAALQVGGCVSGGWRLPSRLALCALGCLHCCCVVRRHHEWLTVDFLQHVHAAMQPLTKSRQHCTAHMLTVSFAILSLSCPRP